MINRIDSHLVYFSIGYQYLSLCRFMLCIYLLIVSSLFLLYHVTMNVQTNVLEKSIHSAQVVVLIINEYYQVFPRTVRYYRNNKFVGASTIASRNRKLIVYYEICSCQIKTCSQTKLLLR